MDKVLCSLVIFLCGTLCGTVALAGQHKRFAQKKAQVASYNPARAPGYGNIRIIPFNELKQMEPARAEKYLYEIREFLKDQEQKKTSRQLAENEAPSSQSFISFSIFPSAWGQQTQTQTDKEKMDQMNNAIENARKQAQQKTDDTRQLVNPFPNKPAPKKAKAASTSTTAAPSTSSSTTTPQLVDPFPDQTAPTSAATTSTSPASDTATTTPSASTSGCFGDSKLTDDQTNYLADAGDHCVIGGYIVCLSLIPGEGGSNHLWCSPNAKDYQDKVKAAGCGSDQLACAYPFFAKSDLSGPLCVDRIKGQKRGSVTQQCLKSDKGASLNDITGKLKSMGPDAEKNYDEIRQQIKDYCDHKGKNKLHDFDVKDCEALNNRLGNIENPTAAGNLAASTNPGVSSPEATKAKDISCPQVLVHPPGHWPLNIKLERSADGREVIANNGAGAKGQDDWQTGQCDAYYKLIRNRKPAADEKVVPCLYRAFSVKNLKEIQGNAKYKEKDANDPVRTETMAFADDESCQVKYSVFPDTNNTSSDKDCSSRFEKEATGGDKPYSKLLYFQPEGDHAEIVVNNDQTYLMQKDTVYHGDYEHFFKGDAKSGYTELFAKKNNDGKYECFARYQKTLSYKSQAQRDADESNTEKAPAAVH